MGADWSNVLFECGECENIMNINKDTFTPQDELQNSFKNKIEYQLKAYLSANDPQYNTLITSNYKPSLLDGKLLQKLITKSEISQQFAYELIHKIYTDRCKFAKKSVADNINIQNEMDKKIYDAILETKPAKPVAPIIINDNKLSNKNKSITLTPKCRNELINAIETGVDSNYKINILSKSKSKSKPKPSVNSKQIDNNCILNINLKGLNKSLLDIDNNILNEHGLNIYKKNNLILCESGTTPSNIHSIIWPKDSRDLLYDTDGPFKVLPIVYDRKLNKLPINDIISNGIQSSICTPFNNRSLMNYVLSFQMIIVNENKIRIVQIEPSIGSGAIHNICEWNKKYSNIELIQNNNVFKSCLCGMGLFGVIYSYYISVQDAYFCSKKEYMTNWNDFKCNQFEDIKKQCKLKQILGLKFQISPYLTFDNKYNKFVPISVCIYKKLKKKKNGSKYLLCTVDDNNYNKCVLTKYTNDSDCFVWINKVFPQLMPFMLKMKLQTNYYNFDNYYNNHQYKCNQFGIKCNDFINCIDDYIMLCNNLKKFKMKQYVTAPLLITFGNKSHGMIHYNSQYKCNVFLTQPMCSIDNDMNKIICYILTTFQSLFISKYKAVINFNYGFYFNENECDLLKNVEKNQLQIFVNNYQKFNTSKIFYNNFANKYGLDIMNKFEVVNDKIFNFAKSNVHNAEFMSL